MICEPAAEHVVWLDGAFVPWKEATMHVSDHHYGLGVFEGLRVYRGERATSIFRLEDHTARLFRSAHIMKMQLAASYDRDRLNEVQVELIRRNDLKDAYIRPFVFYGGLLGLSPRTQDLSLHVAVMALAWKDAGASGGTVSRTRGVSLRSGILTRPSPNSIFSKAKVNGNYVSGIVSRQEAQLTGADDVLLLDHNGHVTETSGANIFVVQNGTIRTPPSLSVLEGITRDAIITIASSFGYPVFELPVTREDVYVADEVFLTGTAIEVTPVREVDGRRIASGEMGPITERLQATYFDQVRGRADCERKWLTLVH